MRSPLEAFRRRVGALDGAIPPPLGGVGAAGWSVVVAKVQTRWVKSAQKRRFWLNGSALWANRSRARCVDRM